ncbi:HAD family hydrolase [Paenibacillus piri]|uniref:HAD family hydrolase n=1 Tax=Paenibacillus piri TaxID=2547395 RepID=A0A4V6PIL6_9BACL|nr:HAD family hydrolase [Paenibacillus piri]TDG00845.1 HAD family hydrolase [Paenibacillus piri]
MTLKQELQWIFFDLGETLIDESAAILESIRQFAVESAALGYAFHPDEVVRGLEDAYRAFAEFPMGDYMERHVASVDHRRIIKQNMRYRKDMERPFPAALPLVRELSGLYRIGIIANQGPGTTDRLKAYGFAEYITVCCESAEAGFAKPNPQLFQLALEQASCLPRHAVMIGDRIDNDIIPAKRLGMKAVYVRQGLARYQPIPKGADAPDAVLDKIEDIRSLLMR